MAIVISATRIPSGVVLPHQSVYVENGKTTFGRSRSNDWVLPDPSRIVSAQHCEVHCEGDRYYLVDLSTNGTFLNDAPQPLGKGSSTVLQDGDILNIGSYEFQIKDANDQGSSHLDTMAEIPGVSGNQTVQQARINPSYMDADHNVRDRDNSSAGRLRAHLVQRLGLNPEKYSQQEMDHILEDYVDSAPVLMQGLMRLLRARSSIKNDLRVRVTGIQDEFNNPMKFSAAPDEALEKLLGDGSPLHFDEALQEVIENIGDHQSAMISGLRSANKEVVDSLDPEKFAWRHGKKGLMQVSQKARLWDAFCEAYSSLQKGEGGALDRIYTDAFAKAYEEQIHNLEKERMRSERFKRKDR